VNSLSLKAKLGAGFGILLVVLGAMAVLSYVSLRKLADLSQLSDREANAMFRVTSIEAEVNNEKAQIRNYILTGNEAQIAEAETNNGKISANFAKLTELLSSEGRQKATQYRQQTDAYYRMVLDVAVLRRARRTKAAADLLLRPDHVALRAAMDKTAADFEDFQGKLNQAARQQQSAAETSERIWIAALGLAGIFAGLLVASLIARSITASLARMAILIQQLAAGDLSVADLEIASHDEIGEAVSALNRMKNNLRQLIQAIAGTAEHVASASEEISSSASQQAQGAETQKDQTAQVATAMQEMSSTVLQVSENSNKAAESSRRAAETARQGGGIVQDTLAKMRAIADSVSDTAKKVEELGKSSDQIGRIIGVIDDIADQTNLLALNAAIEAARAGEQGRGFAVVADEVRKLAERTTSATKEIAQMIRTVQDETKTAVAAMEEGNRQVEAGVKTTAQAGDSLKEIIETSEEVGELITHIATAATEQSSATEEINSNMDQIAKLVKESADGAQQSAKACQELSGLALDLQKMVSNFKLGDGESRTLDSRSRAATEEQDTHAFSAAAR